MYIQRRVYAYIACVAVVLCIEAASLSVHIGSGDETAIGRFLLYGFSFLRESEMMERLKSGDFFF